MFILRKEQNNVNLFISWIKVWNLYD